MFSTSYRDHIDLVIEYATDLFERGSAQRFIDVLRQVLVRGTSDPSADICALTDSSGEELERQLHDWNKTDVDFGDFCRVDELISAHLATPDKTAVITHENSTSYSTLDASVNQLANHLVQNGIHPGDIVGVHMDRTLDMVVALLAILRCGAGYLPLDPAFPQDRLEYMLSDSGAKGLITHGAVRRPLQFETGLLIDLDNCRDRLTTLSSERPQVQSGSDDVAYILYTSGSTGKPKGVVVPHRGVTNFLYSMQREPGLTKDDILLAVTTMSFDISVLEIFLPLMSGATVFLATAEDALDGNRLADLLDRTNTTVMQATPSTWHMLLESGWRGRAGLKCLCGGEALTNKLASQLHEKCDELWNLYGPTETTVWSTCVRVTDPDAPILVGKPIANTQVYILDAEMNPQPIGVPGELYIGGDGVGLGYKNREELTASVFVDDPFSDVPGRNLYRTGDLARWRNDGQLQHLGRTGSQVKIRGFRIELGEIESVLGLHDSIANVACSVWSPSDGDQRLVAHCVVAEGNTLTPTELRKHLRKSVPDYMVPQHFEPIDEIPLTANGKIDRKSLPAPTLASPKAVSSPPESAEEILVADIWADILGVEIVNRHDNFFDIGGHSLLAVRAAAAIENSSGHRPELREFVLDDLSLIAGRIPESKANATDEKGSRSLLSRLLGR
jgi:amino acid adenylation domain-containing protein